MSVTLRDYLHVIWLRRWIVILAILTCTATAFLVSYVQTREYEATAVMVYAPPTDISDPLSSGSSTDVSTLTLELQSVINDLHKPAVADKAAELLAKSSDSKAGYTVAAVIEDPDAASGASMSDTVGITGSSTDPQLAGDVANAYAQAVIDVRAETQRDRLTAAEDAVRAKMQTYTTAESRLTTDYLMLAQQLNQLQLAEATVTGDFEIVRAAATPASPSSPKPFQAAVVGFAVGLFAGVALAFLLNQLDTRVRTYRDASEILGLPVIGRLPRLPKAVVAARGIVTLEQPDGPFAEAVRMMRSNLGWAAVAGEWKSFLVTSGRQGEGKSSTLCNLAVAMVLAGKDVVVVDADLRAPCVHKYYGLGNVTGLTTVIQKPAPVETVLRRFVVDGRSQRLAERPRLAEQARTVVGQDTADAASGSLLVLTAGPPPPNPGEVVASRRLGEVIAEITSLDADYVLVDAPPLLAVGDAAALAPLVDGLLYVVNLDHCRRSLLEDSREALDGVSCHKIGTVFVGERADASAYYGYRSAVAGDSASTRHVAKS